MMAHWRHLANAIELVHIGHWRHLKNTIELVLLSAHPSPQPKWQIDGLSRFCTAHGTVSSGTLAQPELVLSSHFILPSSFLSTRGHNPKIPGAAPAFKGRPCAATQL